MSRQILFNNAQVSPYDASPSSGSEITNPSQVAAGRVVAFDVDNFSAGPLPLNEKTTAQRVVFVQGGKTGEDPILSQTFNVADIKESQVFFKEYTAPVQQATTVTPTTGNGFATVKVVQVNQGFKPFPKINATVKRNGKAKGAITDEFVKLLNAQFPKFLVASNSGDNLLLTGNVGVSFETSLSDEAEGWTIASTAVPNFGTGTYLHVSRIEEQAFGQQANFLNRTYLPVSPPSYADIDKTYDLHTVLIPTNTTRNIGGLSQKYHELTIAIEAADESPSSGFDSGIDLELFFGLKEAEESSPSSSD